MKVLVFLTFASIVVLVRTQGDGISGFPGLFEMPEVSKVGGGAEAPGVPGFPEVYEFNPSGIAFFLALLGDNNSDSAIWRNEPESSENNDNKVKLLLAFFAGEKQNPSSLLGALARKAKYIAIEQRDIDDEFPTDLFSSFDLRPRKA